MFHSHSNHKTGDKLYQTNRDWFLVQKTGALSFCLPPTDIILIGRENCDINLKTPSVDKRHGLICFDPKEELFSIRDLNTTSGTYLNGQKIPSDQPKKLNNLDLLRFGYDPNIYEVRATNSVSQPTKNFQGGSYSTFSNSNNNVVNENSPTYSDRDNNSSSSLSDKFYHSYMQGDRGSGISSPSLNFDTFDSGRGSEWSSSSTSSPAKDMSPVPTTSSNSASPSTSLRRNNKDNNNSLYYIKPRSSKLASSSVEEDKSNLEVDELCGEVEKENKSENLSNVIERRSKDPKSSSEFSDLSVPNEVFLKVKEEDKMISSPKRSATPSENFSSGLIMSRPRSGSFSGVGKNQILSPLYGKPSWWPENLFSNSNTNRKGLIRNDVSNKNRITSTTSTLFSSHNSIYSKDEKESETTEERLEEGEKSESDCVSSSSSKKLCPAMAFTVDFDMNNTSKKHLGIADSISKFAPRHRRNLSLTRAEDIKEQTNGNNNTSIVKIVKKEVPPPSPQQCISASNKFQWKNGSENLQNLSKGMALRKNTTVTVANNNSKKDLPPKKNLNPVNNTKKPSSLLLKGKTNLSGEKETIIHPSSMKEEIIIEQGNKKGISKQNCDAEDNTSETGTYTIEKEGPEDPEVEKARKNIDKIIDLDNKNSLNMENKVKKPNEVNPHNNDVKEETNLSWVREWAERASLQNEQDETSSNSDLHPASETQFFLKQTENLVSAMQERVTQKMSNSSSQQNSDSDDEATLSYNSPNKSRIPERRLLRNSPMHKETSVLSDSGYGLGYHSDSSNEGSRSDYKSIGIKYNKAFSIRRNHAVGYDSDSIIAHGMRSGRTSSPRPHHQIGLPSENKYNNSNINRPVSSTSFSNFQRNDGGRFSLIIKKSNKPPLPKNSFNQKTTISPLVQQQRSNIPPQHLDLESTKSSSKPKQQQFGNNSLNSGNIKKPPPLSAGNRNNRSNSTLTAKEVELANWKRRKSYDPMKAAAEGKKKEVKRKDDSASFSEKEEEDSNQSFLYNNPMRKSTSFLANGFHNRYNENSDDEELTLVVDEMESPNSPTHLMTKSFHEDVLCCGIPHSPVRQKHKLEALDNLVISTIHSLANKVRTSSRKLLEKLLHRQLSDENGALLEEMVSQLKELENTSGSSPVKSPSRELSGTLRNLKKLEQVILVLDRLLCDDELLGSETQV